MCFLVNLGLKSWLKGWNELTAVVFALQDGRVEVLGRPSVWGGGHHGWVVPLSLLHRARLVPQNIHQRSVRGEKEGGEVRNILGNFNEFYPNQNVSVRVFDHWQIILALHCHIFVILCHFICWQSWSNKNSSNNPKVYSSFHSQCDDEWDTMWCFVAPVDVVLQRG